MTKADRIQTWFEQGGYIEISWSNSTQLYYAEFNEYKPPYDYDGCGSGETPMEALESLIEDVNKCET